MWAKDTIGDPFGVYKACFGDMIDGTVYDDGMQDVHKAINIGAASGTAGYAMTPVVFDQEIVDITRAYTPIQTLIPKRSNAGITANYYRLTARAAAEWQTEEAAQNEADDTREAVSEPMKILRIAGKVTGFAQAGGAHFKNALREDMISKTLSMNYEVENALINGDSSTNALEPNGLIKLLDANNTNLGASVTLSDVNAMLDDTFTALGHVNLMITDTYTLTNLKQQMLDYVTYVNPTKIAWGLNAVAFISNQGAIPIVASQYMPTATGDRRILAVDTRMVEQRVLLDTSFEDLAKTDDSRKFMMKTYRANIVKFAEGMGQLTGITSAV